MTPASTTPAPTSGPFSAAAERVARRLVVQSWLRMLGRTALLVFGLSLLTWAAVRWWSGVQDRASWALLVPLVWLAVTAMLAWLRKPAPFAALAAWDHAAGENEALANAWFFEQSADRSAGARLHLAQAGERLVARGKSLAQHLPLRLAHATWIAPLLFLAFAFSGWLRAPLAMEDRGLSAENRARAQGIGKELAQKAASVEPLKSLTEQEKERVEALTKNLQQTARQLAKKDTSRELLEDLERNAREAEKLADALGGETPEALSQELLAELESNADTADLGNALRAEDLGRAAAEARKMGTRLGRRKPSIEEQNRLQEALKRALARASKRDLNSALGKSLADAQRGLSLGRPKEASEPFDRLAQQYDRAAQRHGMQKRLRSLAQNFRGAGQSILGGNNLQRLMPSAPAGSAPLAGNLQPGSGQSAPNSPMLMQPMPGSGGAPLALVPTPPGSRPSGRPLFPMPGTGNAARGGVPVPIPGAGAQPGGAGAFPIPGGGSAGAGAIAGAAQVGNAAGGGGSSQGGSQAGRGTQDLGAAPTQPIAAANTGVVAPVAGGIGPSEVHTVAGDPHREAPARSSQELAIDFIKGEETALADEPLPVERREQVLRYFTALRQQFEKQP